MKNLVLPALLPIVLFTASCLKEQKKITMTQVAQIEDSLLKGQIIPSTTFVHLLQDDDYTNVTVIIGNARLYKDKDKISQAAVRAGLMLTHVLGPDMTVSKASLVISLNDPNEDKVPADGISADMKMDSLKKVVFPK
jgi:hypothetical protein